MRILFLIFATLFLISCNSTNGVSVYRFDNQDLEQAMLDGIPQISKKLNVMGIPLKFGVEELKVNIGPENRDVVVLSIDTSANINALLLKYDVGLALVVEGSPYYDSEQKAVFLRNLNLLSSSIDAGGYKGNLGVLNKEALRIINSFLATNPVYKLDTSDPKVALLSALPLDLRVENGAIAIVPRI